jgi:hypothetical protein
MESSSGGRQERASLMGGKEDQLYRITITSRGAHEILRTEDIRPGDIFSHFLLALYGFFDLV